VQVQVQAACCLACQQQWPAVPSMQARLLQGSLQQLWPAQVLQARLLRQWQQQQQPWIRLLDLLALGKLLTQLLQQAQQRQEATAGKRRTGGCTWRDCCAWIKAQISPQRPPKVHRRPIRFSLLDFGQWHSGSRLLNTCWLLHMHLLLAD